MLICGHRGGCISKKENEADSYDDRAAGSAEEAAKGRKEGSTGFLLPGVHL